MLVFVLRDQTTYRVMIRPCLGRKVFQKFARDQWKLHLDNDAGALATFNKRIRGLTFSCKISTWQPQDGGDALITAFALD
ncbi:MAG: hypothetical protein KGI44_33985 [Pseudomonas sp.]|uniref:hypothetical protein n=1 Tax=Pseudomonas sp. TaxID=306 RepID=UPI00239047D9|nr:hypothetical protein [Pseudomonas sp.]MDE1914392.1 hypothetical protein [Pseudomonas sp.]